MNITRRRNGRADDEGFTLIELLVVVVIIGVLVAIAVPVYLNYRKGAADKSAQSDVRGAVSAIEQYYTDNGNTYPTGPTTVQSASFDLVPVANNARVILSDKTQMIYIPNGTTGYTVCATNTGGTTTKIFKYSSATGGSVAATGTAMTTGC